MNFIILEFVRGHNELPKPRIRILYTLQEYSRKLYYLEDEKNKDHLDVMKSLTFLDSDYSRDLHKFPDGWSGNMWHLLPLLYDNYARTQDTFSNGFILYADRSLKRCRDNFNTISNPYIDLLNSTTQVSTVICLDPSSIEDEYIVK